MDENPPSTSNNAPDVPPAPAAPPPPSATLPPHRPPVIAAPAPAKKSSGRGWMVFALILLVLLVVSVMGNFVGVTMHSALPVTRTREVGPRLEEAILEDHEARNKIAVIDVDGIITSRAADQGYNMVEVVKAQLERAEKDDRVKAVILKVDSPGGEVLASDDISRAIKDFQTKADGKPVICSMGNLAASGGYYISAPCRWIVANELTITGSIGVIMSTYNYRGLMDKIGLRPETFKSGEYKDMLSGSREPDSITPKEREMVQNLIDETYAKFKSVVADGRKAAHEKNKDKGRALADDWVDYADGRILSGTEAYRLGFVDELGTFDDTVKRAKAIAGIRNANLVEYKQRYDFADFFRMFGQSESKAVKVDLGMDAPKLKAGQLYFLSTTFFH